MKKECLLILFLISCLTLQAQILREFEPKTFNWGGKIGFNSIIPVINSFTVDGTKAQNITTEYKVGYTASLFCRINMDNFFIQPAVSWNTTESIFTFDLPTHSIIENNPMIHDGLKLKNSSIDIPVLIGYNIVKQGPYALSLMVGPKFRYNYNISYSSVLTEDSDEYTNDSTPFSVNFATGVGVAVWRLFFDFTYEFGLNKAESNFKEKVSSNPADVDIVINKRTNMMSFSLGFLF